jgi:hypothetical protein
MIRPTTLDDMCRAIRLAHTGKLITGIYITRVTKHDARPQMFVMPLEVLAPFASAAAKLDTFITYFRAAIAFLSHDNHHIICHLLLAPGLYPEIMRELNFDLWQIVEEYTGTLRFEAPI